MIRRFESSSENADDLFQIGCVGLMKAVDHFDPSRMVKFSTYAVPMIIGEIRRYLRDNSPIRVSRSLRDTAYKAIYAREGYIRQHMKEPTVQEIADEIRIAKEDVVFAMDAIQSPMSLQEPVYSDGGDTLYVMDQVSDKKNKKTTGWRSFPWKPPWSGSMSGNAASSACVSSKAGRRWRWRIRSGLSGPGKPAREECAPDDAEISARGSRRERNRQCTEHAYLTWTEH